jgi:hypothetical protein
MDTALQKQATIIIQHLKQSLSPLGLIMVKLNFYQKKKMICKSCIDELEEFLLDVLT